MSTKNTKSTKTLGRFEVTSAMRESRDRAGAMLEACAIGLSAVTTAKDGAARDEAALWNAFRMFGGS